jgi:hypothetical protein
VVIIEPGLIKTEFATAAVGSMSDFEQDGPYAKFNQMVAAETAGVYEGPLAKLGGGPEAVAKVIEKAITRRRPRTRYPVTPSARLGLTQRRLVTDRMWDRLVGTQFPRPR